MPDITSSTVHGLPHLTLTICNSYYYYYHIIDDKVKVKKVTYHQCHTDWANWNSKTRSLSQSMFLTLLLIAGPHVCMKKLWICSQSLEMQILP